MAEKSDDESTEVAASAGDARARRAYEAPRVVAVGNLRDILASGMSPPPDAAKGSQGNTGGG